MGPRLFLAWCSYWCTMCSVRARNFRCGPRQIPRQHLGLDHILVINTLAIFGSGRMSLRCAIHVRAARKLYMAGQRICTWQYVDW